MSKLQPNFSWQKYEGKPEDQWEQFEYQLMQQHILAANAINATIDDSSNWSRERQTSFTWVDGKPIYTKTFQGTITLAPGATVINHQIIGLNVLVRIGGGAQDAYPLAVAGIPLPHVDPNVLANSVGISVNPTQIFIVTANAQWLNYLYSITIEYTKL